VPDRAVAAQLRGRMIETRGAEVRARHLRAPRRRPTDPRSPTIRRATSRVRRLSRRAALQAETSRPSAEQAHRKRPLDPHGPQTANDLERLRMAVVFCASRASRRVGSA
jgi:hypothetical protein